jgi:enoyl-CoA hydratase
VSFQHLEVETAGQVATLWFNRPDKLNAMSADIWEDLPRAMAALDDDPRVRVIIIAGRGRAFSVGIDLEMLAGFGAESTGRDTIYATVRRLQATVSSLAETSKPVIAAVHGYCLGAGTNLVSAADLRLASSDAVFSIRETRMGLVADVGALQRLPGIIGQAATAEMALTGADYDAAWALEHGLVSRVLEDQADLMGAVEEIAGLIAANSPLVTSGIKAVLRYGAGRPVEDGLEFVAQWNADHLISNDLFEAMAAHLERRPPIFTGE